MVNRIGWVYTLFDTDDPQRLRYVGKTVGRRGVSGRVYLHTWGAKNRNQKIPSANWIRKIGSARVGYVVLEEVETEVIDEAEIRWIRDLRELGMADLNVTDGGDGQTSEQVSGDKNPRAKLTWEIVRGIREAAQIEYTPTTVFSQAYGLTPASISKILRNSTWFDPEYDPQSRVSIKVQNSGLDASRLVWRTVTDSEVEAMRSMYLGGKSVPEIQQATGNPSTSVRRALFEKYGSDESRLACVNRKASLKAHSRSNP